MSDVSPRRTRIPGRWIPRIYLGWAAALIPWDVYLAATLPRRSISDHYRNTWVGFDVLLIIVLARIGRSAARRDPRVVLPAAAGGALLVADAWFDVTTSAPGAPHIQAILAAVLLELPAAALCWLLARRGLHALIAPAQNPNLTSNDHQDTDRE